MNKKIKKRNVKLKFSNNLFSLFFRFSGILVYYLSAAAAAIITAGLGLIVFPFFALHRIQQKIKNMMLKNNGNKKFCKFINVSF